MVTQQVDESGNQALEIWENLTGPLSMIAENDKNVLLNLPAPLYQLRQGLSFMADLRTAAMTGSNGLLLIVPNANTVPHLIITLCAAGTAATATGARFSLTEGATAGQIGTAITAYNRNRNSAIAPTLVISQFARTYVNGTTILQGTSNTGNLLGDGRETYEVILKSNKTYSCELVSGGGNDVLLSLSWTEIAR